MMSEIFDLFDEKSTLSQIIEETFKNRKKARFSTRLFESFNNVTE